MNVLAGMQAQRLSGEEAWRRRQRYSISAGGRARSLGMSIYEERVFTPGGGVMLVEGRGGGMVDSWRGVLGAVGSPGSRSSVGKGGKEGSFLILSISDLYFSLRSV